MLPPAVTVKRVMGPREWAMLVALSLLWGGSFFFTGVAVHELPPLTLVTLRVGLAALILNLVAGMLGLRLPRNAGSWRAFAGMGLLNNVVPFCLIVWGQSHIASGLAAILNATTPLATVIVAHFLTADERMTGNRLAGVLIGLLGVVLIVGPEAFDQFGANLAAQLAVLLAAIAYACAGVFGRRFKSMGIPPLLTATGQVTASTLLLAPIALIMDQPWTLPAPSGAAMLSVLALAALSTALAYVLYFRILATAGATNLLLVTFLIPVSAIGLGWLVLGERLAPAHFLGMGLIAGGLAAIDGRPLRLVRARRGRGAA